MRLFCILLGSPAKQKDIAIQIAKPRNIMNAPHITDLVALDYTVQPLLAVERLVLTAFTGEKD